MLAQQGIDLVDTPGRGVLDGEDGEIHLARQQRADGLAECAVARQVRLCPPGGEVLARSRVAVCVHWAAAKASAGEPVPRQQGALPIAVGVRRRSARGRSCAPGSANTPRSAATASTPASTCRSRSASWIGDVPCSFRYSAMSRPRCAMRPTMPLSTRSRASPPEVTDVWLLIAHAGGSSPGGLTSTKASYHGLLLSARSAIRPLGRASRTGSCLDQGTRMPA